MLSVSDAVDNLNDIEYTQQRLNHIPRLSNRPTHKTTPKQSLGPQYIHPPVHGCDFTTKPLPSLTAASAHRTSTLPQRRTGWLDSDITIPSIHLNPDAPQTLDSKIALE